jgi:hypothetical protein
MFVVLQPNWQDKSNMLDISDREKEGRKSLDDVAKTFVEDVGIHIQDLSRDKIYSVPLISMLHACYVGLLKHTSKRSE